MKHAQSENQEQEPVAWMANTGSVASLHEREQWYALKSAFNIPLYTTPPAAQRPWVGLTDEDVNRESTVIDARLKLAFHSGMYVAQKILKEKNT